MRVLALLSALVVSTSVSAFKFHGDLPKGPKGNPISHQLPHLNKALTLPQGTGNSGTPNPGSNLGKRRLATENFPSADELENIAREFDDLIPESALGKRQTTNTKLNGVVAVFSQQGGSFMGYLALNLTKYGTTPLTTDTSKVAYLKIPSATPPANFNLGIYNAPDPYLAVIEGYSGSNWGKGKPGYGSMTVVQDSTFPASNLNNPTFLPSESRIWTANVATGQLTATWFNDNGTPVPCTIYYDVTYGDFGFTGDLVQYVKLYLDTTIAVTLWFVPLW